MRRLAFGLSLLFVFTIPWETVIEHPAVGSVPRLIGFALATVWLAAAVATGRVRKPNFFHGTLGMFVALNMASILWSANSDRTSTAAVTWGQLLLVSYIIWDLYTDRNAVAAALQMYILGGYVVLGSALANFFTGNTFYPGRFSAAGTSPDDLGVVLALGIPVAAYLAVFRPAGRLATPLKLVNWTYLIAGFIGIALSGTRTALIVALPGMLFTIAAVSRLRWRGRMGLGLLFMAAAIVVIPRIPEASFERLGTTRREIAVGDLNGRARLWREGLAAFEQHPLLGVGSNMFRSVNEEDKVAHNSFLSVLVELGAPGFLLFAIILVAVAIQITNQPLWDRRLWLCLFMGWTLAASMLTWEHRKPTWLFLNLAVASAALVRGQDETALLTRSRSSAAQAVHPSVP